MALSLLPLAAAVEAGGYVSYWKAIPVVLLLLVWARMLTWIDKDADAAFLPREPINLGFIGGAVLAFGLFFVLPNFWIAFGVLLVLFLAEVGTYLAIRNKKVGLADLKDSLRESFARKGGTKEHQAIAGEVALMDKKGTVITPPTAEDPEAPGFLAVQQLLADPLTRGAERIDMAPADGQAQVRYQVDGVPYNAPAIALDASQAGVSYLKRLAGLDLNERRKPQKGKLRAALGATRHEVEVQTAGSAAGEFLKILIDPKKRHTIKFEDLGMSDDQFAKMKELINEPGGIVLVSAPKAAGLTTLLYAILRAHDAFLTHMHTVERAPDEDLEGISQNPIPANATPEDEYKQVAWVTSQAPELLMVSSVESPKTAQTLVEFAGEERRVYVGLRAGSTFQALEQWRKLVGDDATAMKHLRMVISGRVMRRLCNACKVAYAPDPDTVRKLNLDPSKVDTLYMPRKEPMRDPKGNVVPCDFCKELRYKGRFGVYEILDADKDVKQIVSAGGSVNQLKAVFKKQRSRFLQEQALRQVIDGETSVQEMLRVLREDGGAAPAGGGGGGGGAARPSGGGAKPSAGGGAKPAAAPGGARPPARRTGT